MNKNRYPSGKKKKTKPVSKLRRTLFWSIYGLVFIFILVVLLFPYDTIAERFVIRTAARNGFAVSFESFDYKIPSRLVCRGMTVKPIVSGSNTGPMLW